MYKTGSEARQKYEVTPCWRGEHDAEGCSGSWRFRRTPLRPTSPPALLPLLGPELDRLISHQLPAMFQQRWLPAGHHLSKSHLQALAPAVVAAGLEMEHLAAIADPALLG